MTQIDKKKCPICLVFVGLFIFYIFFVLIAGPVVLHSLGQVPYALSWPILIMILLVHSLSFGLTLFHVNQNFRVGLNPIFFKFFVLSVMVRFLFLGGITLFILLYFKAFLFPVLLSYIIIFFLSLVFEVIPGIAIINWFDKQK